jgi:hypothetical protein
MKKRDAEPAASRDPGIAWSVLPTPIRLFSAPVTVVPVTEEST